LQNRVDGLEYELRLFLHNPVIAAFSEDVCAARASSGHGSVLSAAMFGGGARGENYDRMLRYLIQFREPRGIGR